MEDFGGYPFTADSKTPPLPRDLRGAGVDMRTYLAGQAIVGCAVSGVAPAKLAANAVAVADELIKALSRQPGR